MRRTISESSHTGHDWCAWCAPTRPMKHLDRTQGKQQKLFSNYNTPALTQHKNNKNYAQSIRSDVQTARGRENERGRVSEFGTAKICNQPK